jgi:hypothetical protein
MAETPEELQNTLQIVADQFREEQVRHAEREKRARREDERRKDQVAKEVETEIAEEKIRLKRVVGIIGSILTALLAVFSWSYSVIKDTQQKEIVDEKRKTKVDIELMQATDANKKNAENLEAHTEDFDDFRQEQRIEQGASQLESRRQTEMIERTLRSLGKRPRPRTPEHKKAAKAAGWDLDE